MAYEVKHYRRITLGLSDVMRILASHLNADPAKCDFRWGGEEHPTGGFPVTIEVEDAPPSKTENRG